MHKRSDGGQSKFHFLNLQWQLRATHLMSIFKYTLRYIFRQFGYILLRDDLFPTKTLNVLALACSALATQSARQLTVVQIGANDGLTNDSLRPVILKHKLAGVLVEPLPAAFQALQNNYRGVEGVELEHAAISQEDGHVEMFVPSPHLHGFSSQQASFNKEHLLRHGIEIKDIIAQEVRALTFKSLLAKHNMSNIDILCIDVEGFDYEILKMALNAGCRPQIIYFEHIHLSREHKAMSREDLEREGYAFVELPSDTLAIAKSVLPEAGIA